MERYFVSYSCVDGKITGFGNAEILWSSKVTDYSVVQEMTHVIAKQNGIDPKSLVILNFQRFEAP